MGFFDGFASAILGTVGLGGQSYMNSKMQKRGQKFEHEEAILNRNFQQAQFEKGMDYNSAEALKQRDWEAAQAGITRGYNRDEAIRARNFNHSEAILQRNFEDFQARTQYQRAVGDLKKAGLNPIMAAFHGGNSVPSGAVASSGAASANTPGGSSASAGGTPGGSKANFHMGPVTDIMGGLQSAFAIAQRKEEIKNLAETNNLIKAQTEATRTQASLNSASASEHVQRVENLKTAIDEMKEHIRTMITQQGVNQADSGLKSMLNNLTEAEIKLTTNHADLYKAQTAVERVNLQLRGYEVPAARNKAEASSTWWGKNVSPFLPDAAMFGGTAAAIRSVFGR